MSSSTSRPIEEDEMMRLAQQLSMNEEDALLDIAKELSLSEEASHLQWSDDDGAQVVDAIMLMEELMEDIERQTAASPNSVNRDTSGNSNLSLQLPDSLSPSSFGSSASSLSSPAAPIDPDLIMAISGKLYWYQRKLRRSIENLPQGGDMELMGPLIHLNDLLSSTLIKADILVLPLARMDILKRSPPSENHLSGQGKAAAKHEAFSTMASIMSMLRRGDRSEVMRAAGQLVQMCTEGSSELRVSTMRDMRAAGALPILLAAVARSHEWPDAEIQISKVISVLVTFEEDYSLLLRSAYEILSVLNMLQIKSAARARSRTNSADLLARVGGFISRSHSDGNTSPTSSSTTSSITLTRALSTSALASPAMIAISRANSATNITTRPRTGSHSTLLSGGNEVRSDGSSIGSAFTTYERVASLKQPSLKVSVETTFLQDDNSKGMANEEVRASVAAALAKLSVVLSKEWSKVDFRLSMEPPSIARFETGATSDNAFLKRVPSTGMLDPSSSTIDIPRTNSSGLINRLSSANTNEQRRRATSGAGAAAAATAAAEASRTLSIVMHVISTASMIDEYQQFSSGTQDNTVSSPYGLPPPPPSDGGPQHIYNFNPFSRGYNDSGPQIDKSTVLCSCTLRNLSEVQQCRPGLVTGNAIKLLVMWLDFGTDFLRRKQNVSADTSAAAAAAGGGEEDERQAFAFELMSNTCAAIMSIVSSAAGGGDESILGWIHTTVVNEGLPSAILRLIHAGNSQSTSPTTRKSSLIPPAATTYLAHALHQLCRRHYFRSHLLSLGVPQALCTLFTSIAVVGPGASSTDGWPVHIVAHPPSPRNFGDSVPGNGTRSNTNSGTFTSPFVAFRKHVPSKDNDPNRVEYAASIVTACLDGLSFFLEDAVTQSHSAALSSSEAARVPPLIEQLCSESVMSSIKAAITCLPRCRARLSVLHVICALTEWSFSVHAMFQFDLTDALVFISSEAEELHTGTGKGSSRSEAKEKERREKTTNLLSMPPKPKKIERTSSDNAPKASSEEGTSPFSSRFPSSSWLSRGDSYQNASIAKQNASSGLASIADILSLNTSNSASAPVVGQQMPTELNLTSEQISEESLTVCYALANICHANQVYASRVFHNNLTEIMLRLVPSSNTDISRQALRCISAMCSVLAQSNSEQPVGSSRQRKAQIFADVLSALSIALQSENGFVQKEAIRGLASLAATDEQVKDAIVDGPLRKVVGLMVDPNSDKELRQAAEQVLIATGFSGGEQDFKMCSYDFQILSDWFSLKRSLKPQALGHRMVTRWIDHLFTGVTLTRPGLLDHSNHSNSLEHKGENAAHAVGVADMAMEATKLLHISSPEGTLRRSSSGSPIINNQLQTLPQLQRHFTDSIMRYLPFCLGKNHSYGSLKQISSDGKVLEEKSPFDLAMPSSPPTGLNSPIGTPNNAFLSNLVHSFTDRISNPFAAEQQPYGGIDIPPPGVLELLDHFFPSKLHKVAMLDMMALGHGDLEALLAAEAAEGREPDEGGLFMDTSFDDQETFATTPRRSGGASSNISGSGSASYYLPSAPEVQAILLPAREYMSFSRVARVVERMVQDGGADKLWSLAFRDSTYHGDFHDSLLVTLRRSPQIVSITFLNSSAQKDTHLGYLAGHLPSSVSFVSFQGSLSKEGVQALCIYLQSNNACFKVRPSGEEFCRPCCSAELSGSASPSSLFYDCKSAQGLVGLAITGCALEGVELGYVKELLGTTNSKESKGGSSKRLFGSGSNSSSSGSLLSSKSSLPSRSSINTPNVRGLKLLDLSFNRLSDAVCADLLRAAAKGPLQGLELGGNFIQRGSAFVDALAQTVTSASRLQYIGISYNNISGHAFCAILDSLRVANSLSSLDLSSNELHHTSHTATALRQFLRENVSMRNLDLCQNKFNAETVKSIHLGLAENETVLLLPLAGNSAATTSSEFAHVQAKLAKNRELYREVVNASAKEREQRRASAANKALRKDMIELEELEARAYNPDGTPIAQQGSGLFSGAVAVVVADTSVVVSAALVEPHPPASPTVANVLNVFFSAPLAWRDRTNQLHALEVLDYAAERDALTQCFKEVHRDVTLRFDYATTDSLRTALSFGCRALHFSGHGHPEFLNFEDGRSGLQLVSVDNLRSLLSAGGLRLDFVFVSACHSRKTGEAFIEAGVPHVVCVKVDDMIQDSAAVSFTRAFYLAFLSGHTVQQAFDIAKEALKASPYVPDSLLEGEKFVLLPEGSTHDVPVFSARSVASWPGPGQLVLGPHGANGDDGRAGLPQPPLDFEGREIDMHRVITTVLVRRLVTLVGDEGVGKSALAAAVCTYIADRGLFEDGVVYMRAQHVSTHAAFLSELELTLKSTSARLATRFETLSPSLHLDDNSSVASPEQVAEERVFACLLPLKSLIVIDNIDNLISEGVSASVFKIFLGELFSRTKHIKILITASSTLGMRHVSGFGVVENCVSLGPLTLRSTLRLYTHFAPSLTTPEAKAAFVDALLPLKQMHVTVDSRELSVVTARILALLGNGHPGRVVKAACESTAESVAKLQATVEALLQSSQHVLPVQMAATFINPLLATTFPPPLLKKSQNVNGAGAFA